MFGVEASTSSPLQVSVDIMRSAEKHLCTNLLLGYQRSWRVMRNTSHLTLESQVDAWQETMGAVLMRRSSLLPEGRMFKVSLKKYSVCWNVVVEDGAELDLSLASLNKRKMSVNHRQTHNCRVQYETNCFHRRQCVLDVLYHLCTIVYFWSWSTVTPLLFHLYCKLKLHLVLAQWVNASPVNLDMNVLSVCICMCASVCDYFKGHSSSISWLGDRKSPRGFTCTLKSSRSLCQPNTNTKRERTTVFDERKIGAGKWMKMLRQAEKEQIENKWGLEVGGSYWDGRLAMVLCKGFLVPFFGLSTELFKNNIWRQNREQVLYLRLN